MVEEEDYYDTVSLNYFAEYNRRQLEEINRAIILIQEAESLIPFDFWEPVKITIKDTHKFEFVHEEWECIICREDKTKKTNLKCCDQSMCDVCIENWFTKENIHCPFCKKDIRQFYNSEVRFL